MTPQQALEILDGAVAQISLNRNQHATLVQALQILAQAIEPKPEATEAPVVPLPKK
jgi:hypothetical protein